VGGTEIYLRSTFPRCNQVGPAHTFIVFLNSEQNRFRKRGTRRVREITLSCACIPPGAAHFLLSRLSCRSWSGAQSSRTAERRIHRACLPFIPQVTAVHDLQAQDPSAFLPANRPPILESSVWAAIRRSRMLLTFSASTRGHCADLPRTTKFRHCCPHGVDEEMFRIGRTTDRHASRRSLGLHPSST